LVVSVNGVAISSSAAEPALAQCRRLLSCQSRPLAVVFATPPTKLAALRAAAAATGRSASRDPAGGEPMGKVPVAAAAGKRGSGGGDHGFSRASQRFEVAAGGADDEPKRWFGGAARPPPPPQEDEGFVAGNTTAGTTPELPSAAPASVSVSEAVSVSVSEAISGAVLETVAPAIVVNRAAVDHSELIDDLAAFKRAPAAAKAIGAALKFKHLGKPLGGGGVSAPPGAPAAPPPFVPVPGRGLKRLKAAAKKVMRMHQAGLVVTALQEKTYRGYARRLMPQTNKEVRSALCFFLFSRCCCPGAAAPSPCASTHDDHFLVSFFSLSFDSRGLQ
jgi:hypothetical protein